MSRRWVVRIAVGALVALLGWTGVCYQVVQNPTVVMAPVAADAIVVLGPATTARTDTAAALVQKGLSHNLVLSNVAEYSRSRDLCSNPPTGWSLVCFVPDPGTTRGEAEYVQRLAAAHGWTNLIVVTSRDHISRARLIFKRCLPGRLQFVAARESISPAQWAYQYAYQSAGFVRAALHQSC